MWNPGPVDMCAANLCVANVKALLLNFGYVSLSSVSHRHVKELSSLT